MSEKDKKTRKIWIISIFSISILNLLYMLTISQLLVVAFASAVTVAAFLYAYYKCAYVKPGIKFLTFMVGLTLVGFALNIYLWSQGQIYFLQPGTPPIQLGIGIFLQLAGLWMLYLNLKMIGVNKRIQAAKKS